MCSTAAQCPAGWSCDQDVVSTSPACAPGENCAAKPAPEPVSAVCHPPYYGSVSADDLETPTSSNGQGTGTKEGGVVTTPGGTPAPEVANNDEPSANESAACQMGHAPASSGIISLLALLGALFGLQRRRAAQAQR
jgi:MYXO-CTERM domain-containing protein